MTPYNKLLLYHIPAVIIENKPM